MQQAHPPPDGEGGGGQGNDDVNVRIRIGIGEQRVHTPHCPLDTLKDIPRPCRRILKPVHDPLPVPIVRGGCGPEGTAGGYRDGGDNSGGWRRRPDRRGGDG